MRPGRGSNPRPPTGHTGGVGVLHDRARTGQRPAGASSAGCGADQGAGRHGARGVGGLVPGGDAGWHGSTAARKLGGLRVSRGDLDGRQAGCPTTMAQGADPILDGAKLIHELLFHLPKPPMRNVTPRVHPLHRLRSTLTTTPVRLYRVQCITGDGRVKGRAGFGGGPRGGRLQRFGRRRL